MNDRARTQTRCDCGHCVVLRDARRRFKRGQNHPHYVARGNEQPLLQDLIEVDPPAGGMTNYLADLDRQGS